MKIEPKVAKDPFTERSNKSIVALVTGTFATATMILFFSSRHLLPFNTPELTPLETVIRIYIPFLLGMAESDKQNHLANKALRGPDGTDTGLV